MYTINKRIIAALLLFSQLLTSCGVNVNLPSKQELQAAEEKATPTQTSPDASSRAISEEENLSLLTSSSSDPLTSEQTLTSSQVNLRTPSVISHSLIADPNPSIIVSPQGQRIIGNTRYRQLKKESSTNKHSLQNKRLNQQAVAISPTRPSKLADEANLEELTITAKGGYPVKLYKVQGHWIATVEEKQSFLSRILHLTIRIAPGFSLKDLFKHQQDWHQRYVEVVFPEKTPHNQGYLCIGMTGILGGGNAGSGDRSSGSNYPSTNNSSRSNTSSSSNNNSFTANILPSPYTSRTSTPSLSSAATPIQYQPAPSLRSTTYNSDRPHESYMNALRSQDRSASHFVEAVQRRNSSVNTGGGSTHSNSRPCQYSHNQRRRDPDNPSNYICPGNGKHPREAPTPPPNASSSSSNSSNNKKFSNARSAKPSTNRPSYYSCTSNRPNYSSSDYSSNNYSRSNYWSSASSGVDHEAPTESVFSYDNSDKRLIESYITQIRQAIYELPPIDYSEEEFSDLSDTYTEYIPQKDMDLAIKKAEQILRNIDNTIFEIEWLLKGYGSNKTISTALAEAMQNEIAQLKGAQIDVAAQLGLYRWKKKINNSDVIINKVIEYTSQQGLQYIQNKGTELDKLFSYPVDRYKVEVRFKSGETDRFSSAFKQELFPGGKRVDIEKFLQLMEVVVIGERVGMSKSEMQSIPIDLSNIKTLELEQMDRMNYTSFIEKINKEVELAGEKYNRLIKEGKYPQQIIEEANDFSRKLHDVMLRVREFPTSQKDRKEKLAYLEKLDAEVQEKIKLEKHKILIDKIADEVKREVAKLQEIVKGDNSLRVIMNEGSSAKYMIGLLKGRLKDHKIKQEEVLELIEKGVSQVENIIKAQKRKVVESTSEKEKEQVKAHIKELKEEITEIENARSEVKQIRDKLAKRTRKMKIYRRHKHKAKKSYKEEDMKVDQAEELLRYLNELDPKPIAKIQEIEKTIKKGKKTVNKTLYRLFDLKRLLEGYESKLEIATSELIEAREEEQRLVREQQDKKLIEQAERVKRQEQEQIYKLSKEVENIQLNLLEIKSQDSKQTINVLKLQHEELMRKLSILDNLAEADHKTKAKRKSLVQKILGLLDEIDILLKEGYEKQQKEEEIRLQFERMMRGIAAEVRPPMAHPSYMPIHSDEEEKEKERKNEEKGATGISEAGLNFIAKHEGFFPEVYKDPAPKGYPTIGYGHKIVVGEDFTGKVLTHEEALLLLRQDAQDKAVKYVRHHVKVALLQHQFDALASFTFNVGSNNFAESTLLKDVNDESHKKGEEGKEQIRADFMMFVKAGGKILPGLELRRKREANLFLNGGYNW